ncbi:MAG: hypothetical protein A2W31_04445 [Planctomycetes bacterium RBG_16_64_10]|nr:MAG: hypothetical protein A2W31_04445 [Planctomycetes bacterium RBG_16_64_10]
MIDQPANADDRLDRIEELLRGLIEQQQQQRPAWLTVAGAAGYSSLSPVSIRRLISSGTLTAHRPARGRVLVNRGELDAVIRGATSTVRRGRGHRNEQ